MNEGQQKSCWNFFLEDDEYIVKLMNPCGTSTIPTLSYWSLFNQRNIFVLVLCFINVLEKYTFKKCYIPKKNQHHLDSLEYVYAVAHDQIVEQTL